MIKKDFSYAGNANACPLFTQLGFISKKWSLRLVMLLASAESMRFGELSKSAGGITPRMLTQRLEEMENIGIVSKKRFNEVPPRVEYFLTDKGKDLARCYVRSNTDEKKT